MAPTQCRMAFDLRYAPCALRPASLLWGSRCGCERDQHMEKKDSLAWPSKRTWHSAKTSTVTAAAVLVLRRGQLPEPEDARFQAPLCTAPCSHDAASGQVGGCRAAAQGRVLTRRCDSDDLYRNHCPRR